MTTPAPVWDLTGDVLSAGRRAGLDRVGTCDAAPFEQARSALAARASG